jgi:hypothetical protein
MVISDSNIVIYECRNALSARREIHRQSICYKKMKLRKVLFIDLLKTFFFSFLQSQSYRYCYTQIFFKEKIILDLSSPHNNEDHLSINELIDKELCSLSYMKLDDAIRESKNLDPIVFTVSRTFLMRSNNCLLVQNNGIFFFKWDNLYYNILRLSFGCRSNPRLFDMLSSSICWIAKSDYNISVIFHLLGDF